MIVELAYEAKIELVVTVNVEHGKPGRMGKDPDDSYPPTGTSIEVMSATAEYGGKEGNVPDWLLQGLMDDQDFIDAVKGSVG